MTALGKHPSKETRRKMSVAMTGANNPMFGVESPTKGKHLSEETRRKIGDAKRGKIRSEETRRKISDTRLIRGYPSWSKGKACPQLAGENNGMFGKHHSEVSRKKISERGRGILKPKVSELMRNRVIKEETRVKLSAATSGENNPMFGRRGEKSPLFGRFVGDKNSQWKGGISFGKYCPKFNRTFKNRVRAFFGQKCVECEMTQEENGRLLDVHHANYNKMVCCNDVKPLFVSLCRSCNSKANANREFWEDWFTEIVNVFYGGRCYLSKD